MSQVLDVIRFAHTFLSAPTAKILVEVEGCSAVSKLDVR